MDNLVEIIIATRKSVNREHLMAMAQVMIRKDFELIRIQDSFINVFRDAEFFSASNDDLASIQHCYELASGEIVEDGTESPFWWLVCDASIPVAFDYKHEGVNQIMAIKRNSEKLAEIIFNSCEQESDLEKQQVFIEGFKTAFPHLVVPYLERRRMELEDGISCQIHQEE